MTRKLVVFDFDGTLVDSQKSLDDQLIEFSALKGLPCDLKKMMVGYVDPAIYDLGWGLALENQQVMLDEFSAFIKEQTSVHKRFIPDFFPYALEQVDVLRAHYDLSFVTARNRDSFETILKHYNMLDYFPHNRTLCCTRERGYALKPAPDALHCLLRDTKHAYEDVVMIGDTTSDIGMANAAGVKSIAVLWGAHPKEKLETAKPTHFLDDMRQLSDTIHRLFNQQ